MNQAYAFYWEEYFTVSLDEAGMDYPRALSRTLPADEGSNRAEGTYLFDLSAIRAEFADDPDFQAQLDALLPAEGGIVDWGDLPREIWKRLGEPRDKLLREYRFRFFVGGEELSVLTVLRRDEVFAPLAGSGDLYIVTPSGRWVYLRLLWVS